MKTCTACKKEKEEKDFYSHFYKNRQGGRTLYLRSECKKCVYIRTKKRVSKGKKRAEYLAYQKTYQASVGRQKRLERFAWMDKIKANPCEDCKTRFPPECMDFDHIDPSKKLFTVSQAAVSGRKKSDVEEEIKKCRLLCANCRRIRTAKQQNRGQLKSL